MDETWTHSCIFAESVSSTVKVMATVFYDNWYTAIHKKAWWWIDQTEEGNFRIFGLARILSIPN